MEINREIAAKRLLSITNFTISNSTIPIEKIESVKYVYKSRLRKIFKFSEVSIVSAVNTLTLDGLYNPDEIIASIEAYKSNNVALNRAIELSSFKELYSKQNDLFHISNQFEEEGPCLYTFRKTIVVLLMKIVPPFVIFLLSSIGLNYIFADQRFYLLNIPPLLIILWSYIDWSNDKYTFQGDRIIDIEKKPFFGREVRIESDINSIQSIKKEQKNFLQVLFNYGDIEIESLRGKIIYPTINNPDKVVDTLYLFRRYYYSRKENQEKLNRQVEFLNYTKYYKELTKK